MTEPTVISSAQHFLDASGRELGVSSWLSIDQARISAFADVSGDHQWIHVDPERAVTSPFGSTIAHGLLTLSLVPQFLGEVLAFQNLAIGVNYGFDRVRFLTPVPVDALLRGRCTIDKVSALEENSVQAFIGIEVELQSSTRPACAATLLARYSFMPSVG